MKYSMCAHGPKGGLTLDTNVPYHAMTRYWHPNASDSDMEAAWDAIDTNAMAVALDDKFVERLSLPPSTPFPWDTERSVYYVRGVHDLHCLVSLAYLCKYSKPTLPETCS